MKSKKHWHVHSGIPNCLPNDSAMYERKFDALAYARKVAQSYREDGYTVLGSAESGRYDVVFSRIWGTGVYIEIVDCLDNCEEEWLT